MVNNAKMTNIADYCRNSTILFKDLVTTTPVRALGASGEARLEDHWHPQHEPHVGRILGDAELEVAVQREAGRHAVRHPERQGAHLKVVGFFGDVVQLGRRRSDVVVLVAQGVGEALVQGEGEAYAHADRVSGIDPPDPDIALGLVDVLRQVSKVAQAPLKTLTPAMKTSKEKEG